MDQAQEKKPGLVARIRGFYHEVVVEMKKVTWPTRPELYGATIVVITVCIGMTVVLALADLLFGQLISLLLRL
ncbi:MAG: preprotein translocase subunit SecE [Candidatus Sumerlaeaceae bacterium]|nr:preprotein translocase subunit SecE [Candidatus Sumerlaeaceae bacterium]